MNNKDNKVSVLFMLFSILFCVCLIAANVLETKQIAFWLNQFDGWLDCIPCVVYHQRLRMRSVGI